MVRASATRLNPLESSLVKTITSISFPAIILLGSVFAADLPTKAPNTKYTGLWTNSPFTSKPPPPPPGEVISPFEDYALLGVSPVGDGYRVTLTNRKNPDDFIFVESSRPNEKHGFKISEVKRKAGDPLGTTVVLNKGGSSGTVSFDTALLTLKAPPVAAPQPRQPVGIPGQPIQPGDPATGQRVPRPRVVPPPVPAVRPGVTPPAANQPQQGGQRPLNNQGRQRTDRRR